MLARRTDEAFEPTLLLSTAPTLATDCPSRTGPDPASARNARFAGPPQFRRDFNQTCPSRDVSLWPLCPIRGPSRSGISRPGPGQPGPRAAFGSTWPTSIFAGPLGPHPDSQSHRLRGPQVWPYLEYAISRIPRRRHAGALSDRGVCKISTDYQRMNADKVACYSSLTAQSSGLQYISFSQ